jgi:hypothetical protein
MTGSYKDEQPTVLGQTADDPDPDAGCIGDVSMSGPERKWIKWDFLASLLEAIGMAINH